MAITYWLRLTCERIVIRMVRCSKRPVKGGTIMYHYVRRGMWSVICHSHITRDAWQWFVGWDGCVKCLWRGFLQFLFGRAGFLHGTPPLPLNWLWRSILLFLQWANRLTYIGPSHHLKLRHGKVPQKTCKRWYDYIRRRMCRHVSFTHYGWCLINVSLLRLMRQLALAKFPAVFALGKQADLHLT